MKVIDARGVYYQQLNTQIKEAFLAGENEVTLMNVGGQRYIGDGISGNQKIVINGTPGNDMSAFMDGLEITVNGNAQDAMANTMNDGRIIVHGSAGDTVGYAMRGGEIYIKGNVGYRVGIHMKEYLEKKPAIIIGGKAGDFFGEYVRGNIDEYKLGKEVKLVEADESDLEIISSHVRNFCKYFSFDFDYVMNKKFNKLYAYNKRPYGNLYAY